MCAGQSGAAVVEAEAARRDRPLGLEDLQAPEGLLDPEVPEDLLNLEVPLGLLDLELR